MTTGLELLKPLLNLPIPSNLPSLRRVLRMFAHFTYWIPSFVEKAHPLTAISKFSLLPHVIRAFEDLKKNTAIAAITTFDPSPRLVVETDASDCAIAASLRQSGRPVTFFSRTFPRSGRQNTAVVKEVYAIIESLNKVCRHFKLITDQKSIAFRFNPKTASKN